MAITAEGKLTGKDLKIGVVVSRFNEWVTKQMLQGALNELRRLGVIESNLYIVWTPGAFELALACQKLIARQGVHAVVALGCIIEGETRHYEYISRAAAEGIQKVALERNTPIAFGVITVNTLAQAIDRAGGKQGNKGRDAARSAVEMAQLAKTLKGLTEQEAALEAFLAKEFKKN